MGLEKKIIIYGNIIYKVKESIDSDQLIACAIRDNYTFYNFDADSGDDAVKQALLATTGVVTGTDVVVEPPIRLITDTHYRFFKNIVKQKYHQNFIVEQNIATLFDPAKKQTPESFMGKKTLSFGLDEEKIQFKVKEGVGHIPSCVNGTYPSTAAGNDKHNMLFTSNYDIKLFTEGIVDDKTLLKKAFAILTKGDHQFIVPHDFAQKSTLANITRAVITKTKNLIKDCFGFAHDVDNLTLLSKDFGQVKPRTPIHYIVKRLGDAYQALYCYNDNEDSDSRKWLVTYDTPLFGIALVYQTPVIAFCNVAPMSILNPVNKQTLNNITVAVRNDLLSPALLEAAKLARGVAEAARVAAKAVEIDAAKTALVTAKTAMDAAKGVFENGIQSLQTTYLTFIQNKIKPSESEPSHPVVFHKQLYFD